MTPRQRQRQFNAMEKRVLFAPRGQRQKFQDAIRAERLKDLRAVADRTRDGWTPTEPEQPDMFVARSP